MGAMTERKFLALIKSRGFSIRRTSRGHYRLVDPNGSSTPTVFAIGHGSNRGMVESSYVKKVLQEILKWSSDEHIGN